jgi:hypothetical protein
VAGLFKVRGDMGSPDESAGLKITLGALELGGGAERLEVLPLGTDDPEEELLVSVGLFVWLGHAVPF